MGDSEQETAEETRNEFSESPVQAEISERLILTENQFYDLFCGSFSLIETNVNWYLSSKNLDKKITTIAISDDEKDSSRGLSNEIYKLAAEPNSAISFLIAPKGRYAPLCMAAFVFGMPKIQKIKAEAGKSNIIPENKEKAA